MVKGVISLMRSENKYERVNVCLMEGKNERENLHAGAEGGTGDAVRMRDTVVT